MPRPMHPMHMSRRLRRIAFIVLTVMVVILPSAGMSLAQEHLVIEGGRYLYNKYCINCHGPRGYGDGPKAASLQTRPANLTLLSQKNEGRFPFWETYSAIDGRREILNHGPRDMPTWGYEFQVPDDEVSTETEWMDQVRGRIWQLLVYLESIQE